MVGLTLFSLGLPRFLGAADAHAARAVLSALREGRGLSDEILDQGAAALERSRRWSGTPANVLSDLALLKLLRAQSDKAGKEIADKVRQPLADAIEIEEAGLRQAPAGSNGWGRLAYTNYLHSGLTHDTRAALEMSLKLKGLDLPLLSFRLQLILEEWDALGTEFQDAAPREILGLTRHGRSGYDALVEIYLVAPQAETIDAVLSQWPVHQAGFARSLERRLGGG